MTTLNDLEKDAEKAWDNKFLQGTSTNVTDRKLYNYRLTDAIVTPESDMIEANAKLKLSAFEDMENSSSLPQTLTFTFNETTTDTFETSITNGIKTSVGITSSTKFEASIFLVGSIEQTIEVSLDLEYDYSSTNTESHTLEKSWTLELPVVAPPYSKIVCTLLIYSADYEIPVNLEATINGDPDAQIDFLHPIPGALYSAFYEPEESAPANRFGLIYPDALPDLFPEAYAPVSRDSVVWKGKAKTVASQSLYSKVRIDEIPLEGHPGSSRTYFLPVTPKVTVIK